MEQSRLIYTTRSSSGVFGKVQCSHRLIKCYNNKYLDVLGADDKDYMLLSMKYITTLIII